MASESPHKQKIIIGIIVVVVLIVLWQVIGLFKGSVATTDIAPVATPATGTAPVSAPTTNKAPAPATSNAPISQVTLQKDLEFLKLQKDVQQRYLSSINELQLLRIQKEIAEANQAIITSKLATVSAEKDISDLLTQSTTPPAPTVGTGGTGSPALAPEQATAGTEEGAIKAKIIPKAEGQYSVISVTMQFDKWNAILSYSGKLYRVNIGDTLPPDGSKVIKIISDGVVLEKNDTQTKVTIVPAL